MRQKLLIIFFLLSLTFNALPNALAQWKNIAPNIVTRPFSLWGAIAYHNGTIIAALPGTPVCVSSDDGITWQTVSAPYAFDDEPHDVDIFDKNNAIIATYKSGLYITHDGGLSWSATSLTTPLNAAKFIGTAKDIVAAAPFGYLLISHDAGITWSQILASGSSGQNDVQVQKRNLSIYALETGGNSSGGNFGFINSTYNGGTTWSQSAGRFNTDSYSFTIDPCNDSFMYVINEANLNPGPDGFARIYFSQNKGKTFTEVRVMDKEYYCGSIVCAPGGVLYLQTQTTYDGILRSTDRGINWQSIGGPRGFSDCRLICTKDDNTIFAVDRTGSIWETTNSGGNSVTVPPGSGSLVAIPGALFINDTIYCNDSISRWITFSTSGCPPPVVTGWSISGMDSLSYSAGKIVSDSLRITFTPKKIGDHQALLILNLSNGRQVTVTLKGYHDSKPFQYSFAPKILFSNDTLRCVDSIIRQVTYKTSGCLPAKITTWTFSGSDSSSYSVDSLIQGSLGIIFAPKKLGDHNALLIISLSNGNRDTILLKGYNDNQPFQYSFTPETLFVNDTVVLCDSQVRKAMLKTSGCLPKIISQAITGAGANNYQILKAIGNSLLPEDSVIIEFTPSTGGIQHAMYELLLSDGSKISLPLEGVGKNVPFTFSFDPPSLFSNDSLYLCSQTGARKVFLSVIGCTIPKVISQIINGASASDYTILSNFNSSINHTDSLLIEFRPNAAGLRTASFVLTFSDGTIFTVPLEGFGIAPQQLTLSTADQTTNTIGGTVDVPITISGISHAEDVDLVLNYGRQLTYHSSHSPANIQLDIPGEQWAGRSKLHIAQAIPNTIAGYARFDVFDDSLTKSHVTFDSTTILTAVSPCQYILPESVTSNLTPPSGCGDDIISRFIHLGIAPDISIIPNPSNGDIFLISTRDLGECNIAVYDMLGVKQSTSSATLQKNNPTKIILPVANGVYNVRVRSQERTFDLRVVVNR